MHVLIGNKCLEEFKRSEMEDFLYMIRLFEMKKRGVDPIKSDKPVVFRGVSSESLRKIVESVRGREMQDILKDSSFGTKVRIVFFRVLTRIV